MQTLLPQHVGPELVEDYFAAHHTSDTPWPRGVTLLAISLARDTIGDRMAQLAALAVRSQLPEVRQLIENSYVMSWVTRANLATAIPFVPEPLERVTFEETAAQDADAQRVLTNSRINAERDRRISTTFFFNGKHYDYDPISKSRITGAATLAGFALGQGAQPGNLQWHGGPVAFKWVSGDNSLTEMDAPTCFAFGRAAALHEEAIVFYARALKDAETVPTDFTHDRYWGKPDPEPVVVEEPEVEPEPETQPETPTEPQETSSEQ